MIKKENIFIITMILFPFTLALMILRFTNLLKSTLYNYLIIILILIYLIFFIETLFFMLDDILHSNKKSRLIYVFLLPIIYIPIYYFKYISQSEKVLSITIWGLSILLLVGFYFSFRKRLSDYIILKGKDSIILKDIYGYSDKNNEFTINIDSNYRCDKNLDGYVIACENLMNDSFIGIYSYKDKHFNQGKLDEIMSFHLEDIVNVIKENGYEINVDYLDKYTIINYNDMNVLLAQRNYFFPYNGYSLIFIMEASDNDDNINDLENIIESIQFLS